VSRLKKIAGAGCWQALPDATGRKTANALLRPSRERPSSCSSVKTSSLRQGGKHTQGDPPLRTVADEDNVIGAIGTGARGARSPLRFAALRACGIDDGVGCRMQCLATLGAS
jgi:hypothetical protein